MKFSRVIASFLMSILMVAHIGVPIVSHWCGGTVQERSLIATALCCCSEGDMSMHDMMSMCEMTLNDEDTNSCCHANTEIARADFSDQLMPTIQTVPVALCTDVVALFCNATLFVENPLLPTAFADTTPPDISPPTPALLCVFRI